MNRFLDLSAKMHSSVHWMLLLLFALSIEGAKIKSPLVTLEELQSMKASCDGKDTCRGRARGNDDMRADVNCQCGPYCVRYGTCCMDAAASLEGGVGDYKKGLNCSPTYGSYGSPVFLVEKCPKEWDGDNSIRDLCLTDADKEAEDNSDLMLLLPVSSLKTGITYRNYFCYLCNTVDEIDDSFISWDIRATIYNGNESLSGDLSTLTYDPQKYEWTFPGLPQDRHLTLKTEPPKKLLENFSIYCRSGDVISTCASDWTDDATRAKCGSYTALVSMGEGYEWETYRNVHCGICNGRSTVQCELGGGAGGGGYGGGAQVHQELFLISEKPEKRCEEGTIHDKVTDTCRNIRCGKKMKMVKGQCVRED